MCKKDCYSSNFSSRECEKNHEQKEKGQTVHKADFVVDLTDSKFTSDGMFCKLGGHTCVPI